MYKIRTKYVQNTYKICTKYVNLSICTVFCTLNLLLLQWYVELRKPIIPETQLRILHLRTRSVMKAIKEMFPRKTGQTEGKAWKFPKMHKLLELTYNVYKWGQLLNTSCQAGERAHTALTKKAYLKTNCKNSNKQMVEKYLRRVGAMRRSENVALLLEKNPNHRLHWKGLDPRWRWHRSLASNRAKRVCHLTLNIVLNYSVYILYTIR